VANLFAGPGKLSTHDFQTQTATRPSDDARQHARARGAEAVASWLNAAFRHVALIDVSGYPADPEVPSFRSRVKWGKCGSRGNHIDVWPNWKEQPSRPARPADDAATCARPA
jgi:hypothetical protein